MIRSVRPRILRGAGSALLAMAASGNAVTGRARISKSVQVRSAIAERTLVQAAEPSDPLAKLRESLIQRFAAKVGPA